MRAAAELVGDRIGRLALVAWPDGAPAPRLDDLTPRGLGQAAVLLVRRIVVVAEPGTVSEAVGAELATAAATAVRPARGYVEPGAEVVLFVDTAELLACYLLSLERAWAVPGWVWTQLAGSLPPPSLTAVLRDPATPVAAVLAVLVGWARLREVVAGLDVGAEERVVEALAVRQDLWVRAADAPADPMPRPSGPAWASGRDPAAASGRPPSWAVGRRGSDLVVGRVSSGAAFAESLAGLVRALLGTTGALVATSPRELADAAGASGSLPPPEEEAAGVPGREVAQEERESAAGEVRPREGPPKLGEAAALPEDAVIDVPLGPGPVLAGEGLEGSEPEVELEGVATGAGGVLYLVNSYVDLDLAAYGLADAVPWDIVDGLGRAALAAVKGLDDSDPLWGVLGALAGRSPGERPAPMVLGACDRALAWVVTELDLGPDEPPLGELLLVAGRIRVDHTGVDLYVPLDSVHLSVRRRALDADPGWVPALGRVVRFHFVGDS